MLTLEKETKDVGINFFHSANQRWVDMVLQYFIMIFFSNLFSAKTGFIFLLILQLLFSAMLFTLFMSVKEVYFIAFFFNEKIVIEELIQFCTLNHFIVAYENFN